MSILLIRHGETALNAARIVQHPDTPLNDRGMGQARRLAERLANFPIAAIVSSDYKRAHMTAEAIAGVTGLPIAIQESLRERNFGDVRGVPHADLPVDLYDPDYHPPGGENWAMFNQRVATAWEEVTERAAQTQGDLVVVSHALVGGEPPESGSRHGRRDGALAEYGADNHRASGAVAGVGARLWRAFGRRFRR